MAEFKMTEQTRDRMFAALSGLTDVQKSQILAATADLLAEAEMHIMMRKYQEEFRQQWVSTLATMLR